MQNRDYMHNVLALIGYVKDAVVVEPVDGDMPQIRKPSPIIRVGLMRLRHKHEPIRARYNSITETSCCTRI
jgi:hypothetical protein